MGSQRGGLCFHDDQGGLRPFADRGELDCTMTCARPKHAQVGDLLIRISKSRASRYAGTRWQVSRNGRCSGLMPQIQAVGSDQFVITSTSAYPTSLLPSVFRKARSLM